MDAVAAGLLAWFNTLPFKMIAMASAAAMAGLVLFTAYREGRHAADEAAAVALAKHNAGIAAKYMRDARAAEDAAARERARADDLVQQVTALKEEVTHVAKGRASPGVDAAVHGLRGARPAPEALPCPVPGYELECLAQPAEPEGHSDLEAAMYLIDTRAAAKDCRSKLQAVRETLMACHAPR